MKLNSNTKFSESIYNKMLNNFFKISFIFTTILIASFILIIFLFSRTIWYSSDLLYIILKPFRDNILLVGVITWIMGILIILFRHWKISLSYIDVITNASNELVIQDNSFIILPEELNQIAIKMNEVKQNALHNANLAKENEQRKNDLIVYLAHDLKTPLTSIIGYLKLLEEVPDLPIEQRIKYTNITIDKAYHLENLINEFFEIARFNVNNITLMKKNLNLKLMLEQIVDEFYPITTKQQKNISILCDSNISIYADSDKLSRVLNNIIKNAISYSFDNTIIEISCIILNENIIITIQNEGYVIPENKLNNIFEQFYRLDDSRNTNTGGTGLGLAISKEIVELHGGNIIAKSNDNITQFIVTLPR